MDTGIKKHNKTYRLLTTPGQGYAMCVLNYDFAILNNAFLIHRPGIKLAQQAKANHRHSAVQEALISNVIMPELRQLYGTRKGCSR